MSGRGMKLDTNHDSFAVHSPAFNPVVLQSDTFDGSDQLVPGLKCFWWPVINPIDRISGLGSNAVARVNKT